MKETCVCETEYGLCVEDLTWCLEENELTRPPNHPNPPNPPESSPSGWANTECKTSELFDTRLGYNFLIALYPNGIRPDSRGFISIYLRLVQKEEGESGEVDSSSLSLSNSSNSLTNATKRRLQAKKWVHATFRFSMMKENGEVLAESALIRKPNKFEIHTGEYSWGYPKFMSAEDFFKRATFKDALVLKCKVELFTCMDDLKKREENELLNRPGSELQTHIVQLLQTGQEADLIISVQGETFKLHECILQCRAPSMLKALKRGSVSNSESNTFKVEIDHVTIPQLRKLFHYVYSGELPPPIDVEDCVALNHCGKKWNIPHLMEKSIETFRRKLNLSNAVECLLNPLKSEDILHESLKAIAKAPRTLYEHPKYQEVYKNQPEVVAQLFDLITDQMIVVS